MACGKVSSIFIFRMVTYTILSHDGIWNVSNFQCITAFTWWPPGEHYNNNNMDPCTLWFQYKLPSLKLHHFMEGIIIFVTNYSKPDKQTLLNFKQETVLLLFLLLLFLFFNFMQKCLATISWFFNCNVSTSTGTTVKNITNKIVIALQNGFMTEWWYPSVWTSHDVILTLTAHPSLKLLKHDRWTIPLNLRLTVTVNKIMCASRFQVMQEIK